MNLPEFPHSAMFVGCTNVGKTEYLLRIFEMEYKNHFKFIVILCPMILDNKTYVSRKWILDDKNVFIFIKTGLEKYCSIKTSHTGVNMWILKNSTNLLSSLGHLGVDRATSIQTFDFSTLYTSIPHDLLKSRMNNIINNAFKHKNGATRYTHIKVGRNKSYFTSDPLNGDNKYTANEICKMIEFLVDMLGLVDSFSDKWLAFLWEQAVPHFWLTCFSVPTKMRF